MILWERLLNRQFQASQLARRLAQINSKQSLYPCITISREEGSEGRLIAKKVAKKLKITYYDKKLVEMITKEAKKKRELISALDEQTQDAISTIVNNFFGFESLPEHTYIKSLARVLLSIAANHSAVILGRGGNFILPKKKTLRIRIVAPFQNRVYHSVHSQKRSEAMVKQEIRKTHRNRKQFIGKYFSKSISNANYYDLVFNTQYLKVNQVSEIITKTFKRYFSD